MVEAALWKLRRRVYQGTTLIDTQWPGPVDTYHETQAQMMAQATADRVDLGYNQLNSLDSTSCEVQKPDGKRRVYTCLLA